MKALISILLVGMGGFAGSVTRYGLSIMFRKYSMVIPVNTMTANIIGCFIIGVLTYFSLRTEAISAETRLLLITGFCGGLTTMSSFVYESAQLLKSNEIYYAVFYFLLTMLFSFLAFFIGLMLTNAIFNR